MPVTIDKPDLDSRLDKLLASQPVRMSRAALVTAMIEQACDRFEATGDANAWQVPAAPSSSNGAGNSQSGQPRSVPTSQLPVRENGSPDVPRANAADDKREGA